MEEGGRSGRSGRAEEGREKREGMRRGAIARKLFWSKLERGREGKVEEIEERRGKEDRRREESYYVCTGRECI